MMPCSSVNSFTSSVVRSALHRCAALKTMPGRTAPPALRIVFADQAAQLLHAPGLVVVAAQVFLEGHRLQHLHALAQRDLLIGLPEEARVVEAGAQHALIAMTNEAVGIAVGVEHGEEMRQQLAVGIFQRKVFLVVAHHGDQNFIGKREKFGIEAAQNDRRKLRQVDDRVEQRLVFAPARAGDRSRRRVERLANALLALGRADDDGASGQRGGIIRRAARWSAVRTTECDDLALVSPARMPANSSGTTSPSSSVTSQRSGRTKRSADLPRQYMLLAQ